VDTAKQRRDVHQSVKFLPATPQAAHGPSGRGQCQGQQQRKRREADRDVGPLGDVLVEDPQVESLVDEQVEQEMAEQVEERGQAQHPAQAHPVNPAGHFSQRGHAKRHQQEVQAPLAERVEDLLDRVGAERHAANAGHAGREPGQRRQAAQQDQRLQDESGQVGLG